jgi:hypothetical protein
MNNFYFIPAAIKNDIFEEYNNILSDVNTNEIDKEDLKSTLFEIALDILPKELYFNAEDTAAKKGVRDFDILNKERDHAIEGIINTYLLKMK